MATTQSKSKEETLWQVTVAKAPGLPGAFDYLTPSTTCNDTYKASHRKALSAKRVGRSWTFLRKTSWKDLPSINRLL